MTRLILLNGPPGSGKSTLARRYAEEHPLTLALDIDAVRGAIGGWADEPHAAGLLARDVALAAAEAHLANGHDVVVAQLLARPGFIERLEALAARTEGEFHEIVLMAGRADSLARRPDAPEVAELYDRLSAYVLTRPTATVIDARGLDLDQVYARVQAAIGPD